MKLRNLAQSLNKTFLCKESTLQFIAQQVKWIQSDAKIFSEKLPQHYWSSACHAPLISCNAFDYFLRNNELGKRVVITIYYATHVSILQSTSH